MVLATKNLVKCFGGLRALDRVSIRVTDKSITLVIGPNGSGKSTLINVISGIYRPDEGKVVFRGRDITGLPPYEVYRAGVVRTFQVPLLFRKLTVLENMLVAARGNPGESLLNSLLRRAWARREEELAEKAFRILELLNLDHLWDKPASELSGGQMKLLEVGRALMADPRVLLMDEPIAGVNPRLDEILEHLTELRRKLGVAMMIVEHRLDIALPYADHVYVMNRGRVISQGSPDEVLEDREVVRAYLGG